MYIALVPDTKVMSRLCWEKTICPLCLFNGRPSGRQSLPTRDVEFWNRREVARLRVCLGIKRRCFNIFAAQGREISQRTARLPTCPAVCPTVRTQPSESRFATISETVCFESPVIVATLAVETGPNLVIA